MKLYSVKWTTGKPNTLLKRMNNPLDKPPVKPSEYRASLKKIDRQLLEASANGHKVIIDRLLEERYNLTEMEKLNAVLRS